jgi:serine/threonine-protein kinase
MFVLSKNHRYKVLNEVNDGAQGTVYQVKDRHTGQICALKTYTALHTAKQKTAFNTEVHALKKLKHIPGVLQLYDTWRTYNEGFIVSELCSGSLDPLTYGKLTLDEVREVAQFLIKTLRSIHAEGVQHNDVKPSNILRLSVPTNQEHYRLCDFGLSFIDSDSQSTAKATERFRGTLDYLAPECLDHKMPAVFGSTDIWSLGVSLYELATGHVPFYHDAISVTVHLISSSEPNYALITDVKLTEFLKHMLIKSPTERATLDFLEHHPYLLNVSPTTVEKQ